MFEGGNELTNVSLKLRPAWRRARTHEKRQPKAAYQRQLTVDVYG